MDGSSEEQAVLDDFDKLIEHFRSKASGARDARPGAVADDRPESAKLGPETWERAADWLGRVRADFAAGRPIVSVCVALDHQGFLQELILDPWLDDVVSRIEEAVRRLGRLA